MPFFSIILPTFNRARMARTALKTVLGQTCEDWECWVIDDGSTDETRTVLAEFKGEPRVRIIARDDNRGMNADRKSVV
jgi:glycosyltransferase involved in cell wall biosynthesis